LTEIHFKQPITGNYKLSQTHGKLRQGKRCRKQDKPEKI